MPAGDVDEDSDETESLQKIERVRKWTTVAIYALTMFASILWIWQQGGCGEYISAVIVSQMQIFLIILILCEVGMPELARSFIKRSLPFLLDSFGRAVACLALVALLFGMGTFGVIMGIFVLCSLGANACVCATPPSVTIPNVPAGGTPGGGAAAAAVGAGGGAAAGGGVVTTDGVRGESFGLPPHGVTTDLRVSVIATSTAEPLESSVVGGGGGAACSVGASAARSASSSSRRSSSSPLRLNELRIAARCASRRRASSATATRPPRRRGSPRAPPTRAPRRG